MLQSAPDKPCGQRAQIREVCVSVTVPSPLMVNRDAGAVSTMLSSLQVCDWAATFKLTKVSSSRLNCKVLFIMYFSLKFECLSAKLIILKYSLSL